MDQQEAQVVIAVIAVETGTVVAAVAAVAAVGDQPGPALVVDLQEAQRLAKDWVVCAD